MGDEEELKGIKFVFPTSFREGGIWYETYKNGCGNNEACAFNIPQVEETGRVVASLIEYEKDLKGWEDGKNIYLAGFSQGSRTVYQVQMG